MTLDEATKLLSAKYRRFDLMVHQRFFPTDQKEDPNFTLHTLYSAGDFLESAGAFVGTFRTVYLADAADLLPDVVPTIVDGWDKLYEEVANLAWLMHVHASNPFGKRYMLVTATQTDESMQSEGVPGTVQLSLDSDDNTLFVDTGAEAYLFMLLVGASKSLEQLAESLAEIPIVKLRVEFDGEEVV